MIFFRLKKHKYASFVAYSAFLINGCAGKWLTSDPPTPSPVKNTDATGSGCCSWSPYLECTELQTRCQKNAQFCEYGCEGKWLTSDAPAPSPVVTPSPIPTATEQPVAAPIQPPTISSPTVSPVSTTDILSCSSGSTKSSWEALSDMDVITYIVSKAPFTLSVLSSGGAAGDGSSVVSEDQAHGVLSAALTLASMEEKDKNYAAAKNKFYGYFNGWKKMCENSEFDAWCQKPFYCNGGQLPCLPGWKQDAALTKVEGRGAAPDADEDAILGMIIAVKAVGNDSNTPFWLEEVRIWADESCTQFLKDNTVLSVTGSHRILGLGSCWGGWEEDGNNPSYHAPGHYRVMRDFQQSFVGRTYTLPSLGDDGSLTDAWNMLIDTSYKFLETTQCPGTGLVPNWALVAETNASELKKLPGKFSGSGTPQFEFGSEAGRTMWRIAVDAIMYPSESASQAGPFLSPLHIKMVEHFDPNPSDSDSYFGYGTLEACSPMVSNVFYSWWWNGFIFGPVLSTLGTKIADGPFQDTGFSQQTMIDVACNKVNVIDSETTYFARSWQVLSMMTLNGDIARAGELVRDAAPSSTPNSTTSPTKTPSTTNTKAPTDATACEGWCLNNMNDWEKKCNWIQCSLCVPCNPLDTPIPTPVPTISPTSSSSKTPTPNSTPVPTISPTSLSTPPSGSQFCCTWNLFNCGADSQCNFSKDFCQATCGGAWVDKNSEAMTCLAIWQECTNKENKCCAGISSCQGTDTYKQCIHVSME